MGMQRHLGRRRGRGKGVRPHAFAVLCVLAGSLVGCGTPGDTLPPVPPPVTGEYRLGPGDQIRITTFGEQQLTGDFRVGDTGRVALPLIGGVDANGRTPSELSAAIAKTLADSKLYVDPKVTTEVTSYRPIFILGEVARPGQYPYQPGMTVVTAVAVAGGFTYRAVKDQFSIVRATDAKAGDGKAVEGRAERQSAVQPGDVITVFERTF
jgi:polysaccharide export outer membrane protein